jgi:hypothetical protein
MPKSLSINHVHGTTPKKRNYAMMHTLQGKREFKNSLHLLHIKYAKFTIII